MLKDNLIADMTENFALRIIEMYRYLRKEKHEDVMSLQIYRSGTSIGANISESKNAQSKPDFVSKLSSLLHPDDLSAYFDNLSVNKLQHNGGKISFTYRFKETENIFLYRN